MADHGLENTPEERLTTRINDLQAQLTAMRTVQRAGTDALNIQNTNAIAHYWTSVANNQIVTGVFTLANSDGSAVFAVPFVTFYEGSIAAGNEIGYGYSRDNNYVWNSWLDWGNATTSTLVSRSWIKNMTGATHTIYFVCQWRYVISTTASTTFT